MGERGRDLALLETKGVPRLLALGPRIPFVVASPQCLAGGYWSTELLPVLLAEVSTELRVEPGRICGTGPSMGGCGPWALALDRPHLFAAIAPACGGGDARLTEYPDAGHDCWTETYDNPGLYRWLLTQARRPGAQRAGRAGAPCLPRRPW